MSPTPRRWLLGGLGWPYDDLLAATLCAAGHHARTMGPLDGEALQRGQAVLPRGQCAPLLYTTGALLRTVEADHDPPSLACFSLRTCGPCRFALFERAWARALREIGHEDVSVLGAGQSLEGIAAAFGAPAVERCLDALAAGDAFAECVRRLRPYAADSEAFEVRARRASESIAGRVAAGEPPLRALAAERGWHASLPRKSRGPVARAVVIGEPWSLFVDGDAQLNVPRVLAAAGVEVEIPPVSTWIAYLLWQLRQPPFGRGEAPNEEVLFEVAVEEARLDRRIRSAAEAAGLGGFAVPSMDEIERHAAPLLPPTLRGGFGHVEVGLAVRARAERRAHVVLSMKSFGCIPSSGVSDAIIPTALDGEIPFLALEVCGDGEATRESRLMLEVAAAVEAARGEVDAACREAGIPSESADRIVVDPLSGRYESGRRAHRSTLACAIAEGAGR